MKRVTTAVVLVDVSNDFLSEAGRLNKAVKPVLERFDVVGNINDLMHAARSEGILVIHVPLMFSHDYREMGSSPYGIFSMVKGSGAFKSGTWGAAVADVLDTHVSDIVVEGKSSTCAFETTNLRGVLDEYGIKTIAIGGLLTNVCIESTMRTAYDMGYDVYSLTNCAATIDHKSQHASIAFN